MKTLFTLVIGIILTVNSFSQIPNKINYQAIIRNTSNALITNRTVGMRISILQGSITGTTVYSETHSPMTNANGIISIEIGGGSVVSGLFSSINWANGPYFIKTETDPNGGTTYTIIGTSQLASVPYALYAQSAGSIGNGSSGGYSHYIGEQFGGGVIFHLWKDDQGIEHGLIVSKTTLGINLTFSNVTSNNTNVSLSSWDGLSNSNGIISESGHTSSVAKLCLDLVSDGHSDWYLPAIDELSLLWQNRFNVNKSLSSISGATVLSTTEGYWSSTKWTDTTNGYNGVWYFDFFDGQVYIEGRTATYSVRAIRAF